MNEADRIWDELDHIYSQWGIDEIPFSESASTLGESRLREVFTGRQQELKEVLSLFKGRERKRLLVYGWIGIGKTAFILEVLDVLQRKAANTLTAYISLPEETDLATASLIALAREMKDDEWAQQLLNQRGLFDLALELKILDRETTYKMLVNYLNSARPESSRYDVQNPKAVKPFTPETAKMLCERSEGVPRLLHRLGSYVLLKAAELNQKIITPDILQQGFVYADRQARARLTNVESMVLNLVLDKNTLSDANVTLDDLQKLKFQEFGEIVVILDKLVQLDLIKRLPNEQAMEFAPTSLLLPSQEIDT